MPTLNRRTFLASSAALLPSIAAVPRSARASAQEQPGKPVIISSANGLPAVTKAFDLLSTNVDPLDAIITGINIVEDDPDDMSVGYGGLPNEDGVVQLDAGCMHGPSHKAGAVAALENIKNPSSVALQVLRWTDHVLLVGAGALKFARQMGFQEQNLLTEKARQAWLKWKSQLNKDDDWLDEDQQVRPSAADEKHAAMSSTGIPFTTGTIHCSAVDALGNLAACTSTSGLSYKLAGRVGDSPIVGAGLFVDNAVGAAGATGRGEAVIQSCGAFQVVRHMADGLSPAEACFKVLKFIADHTRQKYLLEEVGGRPGFDVTLYALRKDGAFASATMHKRETPLRFAIHDGASARLMDCPALFE